MIQTDRWSEYWNNEGFSGEVFVNKAGEGHPQLASYWKVQLSGIRSASIIIDLACGAGSVLADLGEDHAHSLFGADISIDALHLLRERLPPVHVVSCSVSQLPFRESTFDVVVSQFGLEYGGSEAFVEAGKLVSNGGRIAILCHFAGGSIDTVNKSKLAGAEYIVDTDFISKSIELAEAAFDRHDNSIEKAQALFLPVEQQVSAMLKQHPEGIHNHLYYGFKQLFQRRNHYDVADITTWLDSMRIDVEKSILKLKQMCTAANSEDQIKQICRQFTQLGLKEVGYSPFVIADTDLPVAWSITARRR